MAKEGKVLEQKNFLLMFAIMLLLNHWLIFHVIFTKAVSHALYPGLIVIKDKSRQEVLQLRQGHFKTRKRIIQE